MTFDVDAWLDEAAPPTRAVKIYGRGDLVAQLQQMRDEQADEHDGAPAVIDDRLGGSASPVPGPSAKLDALLAELEDSARTFTMRGLLDTERLSLQDEVREQASVKAWSDELNQALEPRVVAHAAVDPELTVQQAERLRERIGQAQWDALVTTVVQASQETIDVPLSRLGSGTGQAS